MTFADLQAVWQTAPDVPPPVSPARLADLRTEATRFDRTILLRDLTEAAAAVVVVVAFGRTFLAEGAPPVARLGAVLAVAGAVFAIAWMWGARLRAPRPSPALPSVDAVRVALARVEVQVRLLRTVAWWYLLPLAVGPLVGMAGGAIAEAPPTPLGATLTAVVVALMCGIVGGVFGWIYRLNQRALRTDLLPLRDRLAALLTDLTSDAP